MRLLVLDGSLVLPSLVRRLAPAGLEIIEARSFERALACLAADPPDAVIANIGPTDLPWKELQELCRCHSPKIPVLFESCIFREPDEAGLGSLNHSSLFLTKPYSLDDLAKAIRLLVRWIERTDPAPRADSS